MQSLQTELSKRICPKYVLKEKIKSSGIFNPLLFLLRFIWTSVSFMSERHTIRHDTVKRLKEGLLLHITLLGATAAKLSFRQDINTVAKWPGCQEMYHASMSEYGLREMKFSSLSWSREASDSCFSRLLFWFRNWETTII